MWIKILPLYVEGWCLTNVTQGRNLTLKLQTNNKQKWNASMAA